MKKQSSTDRNPAKTVGLFLPTDDLRAMRRERCAKAGAAKRANDDHARDVAADVSRLMSLVYTDNAQRTQPDVQDAETLTDDLVRKLIALHLGKPRKAVWTGLGYNAQTLKDLEAEENAVLEAFSAPRLDDAAQTLPTQVPAEFWHHLFEFLVWDYSVSTSGGNGNMVTFRQPHDTATRAHNVRKNPNMDLFAPFYRQATRAGIAHQDVPLAFFVASALKFKNGLETLRVARDGTGVDKEHARFQKVEPSQLTTFYDQVVSKADYNQERYPEVLSQDGVLDHYVDDWVVLLNFVDIRLPNVGLVVQTGVSADKQMLLYSTEAGRETRSTEEQAEQNVEAPSVDEVAADTTDTGDTQQASADTAGGQPSTETSSASTDAPTKTTQSHIVGAGLELSAAVRQDALRQLEAHPMLREVRTKWKVNGEAANSTRLVGMLLARQLTASRSEREHLLASELAFKQPAQQHAMLETSLSSGLDAERLNMDAWHSFTQHMANALDAGTPLPDVDAFVQRVFSAPGVAASERPASRVEQVRRYLAVYANGSDDARAWRDVWQAKWPLSRALEKAIATRVIDVPHVPVETQRAFVRAATHTGNA